MQKKIILFVILSALLVFVSFGTLYATTIEEITADLKILGENGVVGQDIYQTINLDSRYNNYTNYMIMVTQGTKGTVPNVSRQPSKLSTNRRLYIYSFSSNLVTNTNNSPSNDLYYYWNFGSWQGGVYNYQTGASIGTGSYALGDSIEPFYLYTTAEINTRLIHLGAGEEYGGSYLSKKIDFTPTFSDIVNYGDYNNVYAQKVRQNIIYFGTLNTDTNTYKYFRFKLFDTYGEEIGWLDYNVDNDYYSSNVLSAFLPPLKIYIERRLIWLNEVYTLVIYASDGPLNNDNTNSSDSIVLTYVFLRENATINGGTITNTGSGDNYNTQDSTNDIIDEINKMQNEVTNTLTDGSQVDSIMHDFLGSGDSSGDIENIAGSLGFTAFDNPFTSFLFFVIDGVYDVLTEREDIVLSTYYKSLTFSLASTDFITPQSELKTFIRNMLICVYIYGNYKYFHYMITLLETARINKFMAEIGTDEFYDTDIM